MKNETKTSAEKVVKETLKQPKPKLMNIKIEKLHPFENHPYKVLDDESISFVLTTRWITEANVPEDTMSEQMLLNRLLCLSYTEWRSFLNRTKKTLPSFSPK